MMNSGTTVRMKKLAVEKATVAICATAKGETNR